MWTRYEFNKVERPPYDPPCQGRDAFFDHVIDHEDGLACFVPIPYRSVPVWPKDPQDKPSLYYSYYFCGMCFLPVAHIPNDSFQMALRFGFVEQTTLCWCIVLLCVQCCEPSMCSSHYPVILSCVPKVEPVIQWAISKVFLDKPNWKKCRVCGQKLSTRRHPPLCDDADCQTIDGLLDHSPDTAYDKIVKVLNRFKDLSVDIVSPLRWGICHKADGTCLRAGNAEVICKKCKRVEYCSRKCLEDSVQHHTMYCRSHVKMWSLDNTLWRTFK